MVFGTHITLCVEETKHLGAELGKILPSNTIVALFGDLGAGKTHFVRGIAEGMAIENTRALSSPTFTFLNIYQGKIPIYHFDLYRLPREEEFFAAGFDEYFFAGGICCIEWAEKIAHSLPSQTISVSLSHFGLEQRQIEISKEVCR